MSESSHEHVTRRTTRSHHPTPFLHWSCHVVAWDCVVIFHRCFHAPFVWHMFFKPYSYLRCASQPGPPYHEVAASNPPGQCLNALDDKHPSYLCVSELHGETNDKRVKESGKEDRKDGWIHEWKTEGTDELTQEKNQMQPTNPNAHTYVNADDVETHGNAVMQNTFLKKIVKSHASAAAEDTISFWNMGRRQMHYRAVWLGWVDVKRVVSGWVLWPHQQVIF